VKEAAATLREDKGFADLLHVLCVVEFVHVSEHALFHQGEEVLTAEAGDGEASRAACHLIYRHLIESLQKQHLKLREELVEALADLTECLQHAE
jgi:hypothetical protein